MGIEPAGVGGTNGNASTRRWGWHVNGICSDVGALLLPGGGRAKACVDRGPGGSRDALRGPGGSRDALGVGGRGRLTWLAMLTAAAAALVALEFIRPIAYDRPALRATAEGMITLLALLGAVRFRAQFAHTRRLRELMLFGALLTFTVVELNSSALPAALDIHSGGQFGATLQLGQLFVAVAIAAAALTPSNKLVAGDRRPVAIVAAVSLLAFVGAELGGLLARSELIVVTAHPLPGLGRAVGHPLALVVVLLTSALLAFAAAEFALRGHLERDGVLSLLAGAAVLMMAARLYFLAVPWLSSDWITSREGLRLLAFTLVAAAAACQELELRARMIRAAAIAERRRFARDLHDGLAQDLAFIAAHGAQMTGDSGAEHPVAVAARRALAASRGTISDLSDSRATTPRDALEAIAHELRDRFQMAVAVDADVEADLPPDSREHLLRIAREAIANAGRHGHATNVLVSLRQTSEGLALRVRDDGRGIGGAAPRASGEGFGLRSIRERAAILGGELTVRERSRGGTELEVLLP
jgi:signal transduction histidine kinase